MEKQSSSSAESSYSSNFWVICNFYGQNGGHTWFHYEVSDSHVSFQQDFIATSTPGKFSEHWVDITEARVMAKYETKKKKFSQVLPLFFLAIACLVLRQVNGLHRDGHIWISNQYLCSYVAKKQVFP